MVPWVVRAEVALGGGAAVPGRGVTQPVAGADRLQLAEHIAVMDLMALGRAALLPEDDLSLAEALKSPLFGWDDDDLIRLAPRRTGSLHAALGGSPAHAETFARFERLRGMAPPDPNPKVGVGRGIAILEKIAGDRGLDVDSMVRSKPREVVPEEAVDEPVDPLAGIDMSEDEFDACSGCRVFA